jgi:uncharacterized protein (TIGR03083 family)
MRYDALATIRREADAFLLAARRGLEPDVPGCPGWTVRDLTIHLGFVHRFHTGHVGRGVTTPPPEPDRPAPPEDAQQLLAWFDAGVTDLLVALRRVDPDLPAWNWAPHTPQVAAFWPRRMALETAVHRWDAESAHGQAVGFELEVAVDGIDEMLTVMGPVEPPADLPTGVVVVRATDDDATWAVRLAPGLIDPGGPVPATPDAVVEGTASGLLLALWGRVPPDSLTTSGDAALVAALLS